MNRRIWELDAFRGICILGMVLIHLLYDRGISLSPFLFAVKNLGAIAFILLSGICVTLGRHSVRRGLLVLGCGMLCTLATACLVWLGFASRGLISWFGILHCLGSCMLLWPVFHRVTLPVLALLGVLLVAVGLWLDTGVYVDFPWLSPLGLTHPHFASSDYFPLLPNLGWFLLGATAGKVLYSKKRSLLPKVNTQQPILRFLCFCGRHSLFIYLGHQPLILALLWAFS